MSLCNHTSLHFMFHFLFHFLFHVISIIGGIGALQVHNIKERQAQQTAKQQAMSDGLTPSSGEFQAGGFRA